MSKLTDIVNIIVGKTKSIKKELIVLSDQFIVEREVKTEQNNFKVDKSVKKVQKHNLKVEPIGNTEQLSGSEKPTNHIKTKKCLFCENETIGTICNSDLCFEKFEKI